MLDSGPSVMADLGSFPSRSGKRSETAKRLHALQKESVMTKSELIERLVARHPDMPIKDVEAAVKTILDHMSEALARGDRIEIRGFGSFSLHFRAPRVGRNPKTGESVPLGPKFVPHFKPGKELRDQVNVD
ncbi:integration host factor subunit beta [Pokkaliibacter sp. MBI-7]